MSARGIFHKTCPSCATQVPADETRCGCGFSFRAGDLAESSAEGDQAQQELMYEYLRARMTQAAETLEGLHGELLADPKNFDKANRLMKAYADVRELRAELKELSPPVETDVLSAAAKALAQAPMAAQPPQAFRTAQAQKAEKIMQAAGMKTKECGKCRAVLPERAMLCFCGYAFADAGADSATTNTAEPGLGTQA